jgi:hypothetical protein
MAAESNAVSTTGQHLSTTVGSMKAFVAAHPVGIAIVGGIIVGVAAYYGMKWLYSKPPVEEAEASA